MKGLMWCLQVKHTLWYADICSNINQGQKCSAWLICQFSPDPDLWQSNVEVSPGCDLIMPDVKSLPDIYSLPLSSCCRLHQVSKYPLCLNVLIYLFILAPSLHVIPAISSCSICSHNVGARVVHRCWLAPSGSKAVKIMATERRGQSIRARSVGRSGFCASSDTEPWELCFPVSSDRWGKNMHVLLEGRRLMNSDSYNVKVLTDWKYFMRRLYFKLQLKICG